MKHTLAIDVYGTLIDTSGVLTTLEGFIGAKAKEVMETWRRTQLAYSYRRGMMHAYVDFSMVTRQALQYCCMYYELGLTEAAIESLMNAYKALPAFDDVKVALQELPQDGYAKYAFSNGSAKAVSNLLEKAEIAPYFNGVVSVEETKMFKPNPVVYHYFNERTASTKETTWLVSGNPFDVMGAIHYGMKGIWVQRSAKAVFDPWGIEPHLTLASLAELKNHL